MSAKNRTDAAFWARKARATERRVRSRAGTGLKYNQRQMVQFIADKKVPVQMQHCILKVYNKVSGKPEERYLAAFNICAANFEKNGYQRPGTLKLTSKGIRNNRKHQREAEAGTKKGKFLVLTTRIWNGHIKRLAQEKKQQ